MLETTYVRIPAHVAAIPDDSDAGGALVDGHSGTFAVLDEAGFALLAPCREATQPADLSAQDRDQLDDDLETLLELGLLEAATAAFADRQVPPMAPLESLHVEITNRCNLRCRHCYLSSGEAAPDELTLDEVVTLVDTVADLGGRKVSVSGGEPFLVAHLPEVLARSIDRGLLTYVFTNGTRFDAQTVQWLRRLEHVVCQISLEGADEETHDWIRGRGSYREVLVGVQALRDAGLAHNIVLFVTLNRRNIEQVEGMIEFARGLNVARLRFTQINPQGRAIEHWSALPPTAAQWIEYGERVEAIQGRYPDMEITGNVFGGIKSLGDGFPVMKCELGGEPRVDCRGNVYACQMFVTPESRVGSVRDASLPDVLQGPQMQALRERCWAWADALSSCQSCDFSPLCRGGCPGYALAADPEWAQPDPNCAVRRHWFREFARSVLFGR